MTLQDFILQGVLPLLGLASLLCLYRIIRGPTIADRVVGFDLFATIVIATSAACSIATGYALYLDVAMILSIIGFVATLGFADYLQRRKP